MELHTMGIDLGKTVFHLVGLSPRGEVVVHKKFSCKQLLHFTAKLQVELIGMEACARSHFLGRALRGQGHAVRLIPAQSVKPYVKTNKSDCIDAEAIAAAVGRPTMRFEPIKTHAQLNKNAHENEDCQRLVAIPGVGPVTATALIAAIGNGAAFRKGREFAAWMGVVRREHSTGGKQKLLGISKRGNSYLRKLFIQGARAVLQHRMKQSSGLSAWLSQLAIRSHHNVVAVALTTNWPASPGPCSQSKRHIGPRY
jgi:transposase